MPTDSMYGRVPLRKNFLRRSGRSGQLLPCIRPGRGTKTSGLDGIRDRLLNKLASLVALRGNQVLPIPVRPVVPS